MPMATNPATRPDDSTRASPRAPLSRRAGRQRVAPAIPSNPSPLAGRRLATGLDPVGGPAEAGWRLSERAVFAAPSAFAARSAAALARGTVSRRGRGSVGDSPGATPHRPQLPSRGSAANHTAPAAEAGIAAGRPPPNGGCDVRRPDARGPSLVLTIGCAHGPRAIAPDRIQRGRRRPPLGARGRRCGCARSPARCPAANSTARAPRGA